MPNRLTAVITISLKGGRESGKTGNGHYSHCPRWSSSHLYRDRNRHCLVRIKYTEAHTAQKMPFQTISEKRKALGICVNMQMSTGSAITAAG